MASIDVGGGRSGHGFDVLTSELRATKREITRALDAHDPARLDQAGLGADLGHDRLTSELADFTAELDEREVEFRLLAEGTGDSLEFAAYCYEHTDSWIARLWLSALGEAA